MSLIVSTLNDSGVGSLRDAIILSNLSSSSITFSVSGTITLLSPLPQITGAIIIDGNRSITISGNNLFPLLNINTSNETVVIANIILTSGMSNESCAGITSINTDLSLPDVNIEYCNSYYTTPLSYGTILFCDGGVLTISNTDPSLNYGLFFNNNIYFETDIIGGLIVANNSTLVINNEIRIESNNGLVASENPFKIEGLIISTTNSMLQINGAIIQQNNTNVGNSSILGSLIYYDGTTDIEIFNSTFSNNGSGNSEFNHCISITSIPIITLTINVVNFNNMMTKLFYAPTTNLILQNNINITNVNSIAIVNLVQFTNPTSNIIEYVSDNNIGGCLGFEIRAINGIMEYDSIRFDNFSSTSINSIASCFYFPNAQSNDIRFAYCTFLNMNTFGQVIKCTNPNLGSLITVEYCTFDSCTSTFNGSTISFDNTQSKLILNSTTFTSCSSAGNGGILFITNGCQLESSLITPPNNITECQASNGGAIYFDNNTTFQTVSNTIFHGCIANFNGGAIYTNTPINVNDVEIRTCRANNGGAIYFNVSSTTNQLISSTYGTTIIDTNTAINNGGSIYCANNSTLSFGEMTNPTKVRCINSIATNGGFIYLADQSNILFFNISCGSNDASNNGGAIYIGTDQKITIIEEYLESSINHANGDGGTFYISSNSELELHNANLTESDANRGGSIFNAGILTLNNSTLIDSYSLSCLESVGNASTTITSCKITSNTNNAIVLTGTSTITLSEIKANINGLTINSGILNASKCIILDSQIGIKIIDGTMSLNNSTITNNITGIENDSTSSSELINNTIINVLGIRCTLTSDTIRVANNIISNVNATNISQITSLGNNIISNNSGLIYFNQPTDLNNTNPILSLLQDNGGPTLSYIPLDGSPAIDAGNIDYATEFDQRGTGYPRTINNLIDIGSIESSDTPICFTNDCDILVKVIDNNSKESTIKYINVIDLINISSTSEIYVMHGVNAIRVTEIISTNAPKTLIQINPTNELNLIGTNTNTNTNHNLNPTKQTHFTGGHIIILDDGKHVKAKDLQQKIITTNHNYTNVYSLITEITASVKVNNINTLTLNKHKYNKLKSKGYKTTKQNQLIN